MTTEKEQEFDVYLGECIVTYLALDTLKATLPAHRSTMTMPLSQESSLTESITSSVGWAKRNCRCNGLQRCAPMTARSRQYEGQLNRLDGVVHNVLNSIHVL